MRKDIDMSLDTSGQDRRRKPRDLARVEATRRALIAVDEASSPVVACSWCMPLEKEKKTDRQRERGKEKMPVDDGRDVPRGQNNTPLVPPCLPASLISHPYTYILSPFLPPASLSSPSLHLTLLHLLPVGNPFPQTKGSRGPSTSIFLCRLDIHILLLLLFCLLRLAVLSSVQVCNKDVTWARPGHGEDFDRQPHDRLEPSRSRDRSEFPGIHAAGNGEKIAKERKRVHRKVSAEFFQFEKLVYFICETNI